MSELSHLNERGEASMVDVGGKPVQRRIATARGCIYLRGATRSAIVDGDPLRNALVPALAARGLVLVDDQRVSPAHCARLRQYFDDAVRPRLSVQELSDPATDLFLEDRRIYLGVGRRRGADDPTWSLVALPDDLPRFLLLPGGGDAEHDEVIFLDDVIRLHLPQLFEGEALGPAHAFKLSRDAELYLEDELPGEVADQVARALAKRRTGIAARFLFDAEAPFALVDLLRARLGLEVDDLVPGWRYHNLSDLMAFPDGGRSGLRAEPLPPLPHPDLSGVAPPFEVIGEADRLLMLPHQSFDSVLRFLRAAAADTAVSAIWISLYRVARDSAVAQALIDAARRGASVTAFVEVQARFDEATNLDWAERMRDAGVRVLTSREGIKVHAKVALVERAESTGVRRYAYLGTGNFNEKTARVYADIGVFTAHSGLTADVRAVFAQLEDPAAERRFTHLLVAPGSLRQGLVELLDHEMAEARAGRPARAVLKMNALEDPAMVERLLQAAEAGVELDLIIRGICCLRTDHPRAGGRIRARSIVDRFLEHARVFWFHHGGKEQLLVGSADWMTRNLDRRVEVVFPVLDPAIAEELRAMLALQLADTQRARVLDGEQRNARVPSSAPPIRAQIDLYRRLAAPA